MIRPYLSDTILNHENEKEWKIQLPVVINFISSKDSDEIHTIYTKSDNIEIMLGSETDETIKKLLESLT